MTAASTRSTKIALLGWPGAIAILLLTAFAEVLPRLLGTGERAVSDWSLLYVTLHFVLIPSLAVVQIVLGLWSILRGDTRWRASSLGWLAVPAGYLAALFYFPGPWGWG